MMSVVARVPGTVSLVVPSIVKMQIKEKNNTIILSCIHLLTACMFFMTRRVLSSHDGL